MKTITLTIILINTNPTLHNRRSVTPAGSGVPDWIEREEERKRGEEEDLWDQSNWSVWVGGGVGLGWVVLIRSDAELSTMIHPISHLSDQ